jgi:hypothetical protein
MMKYNKAVIVANMLFEHFNTNTVKVVRFPDYSGGFYVQIMPSSYENRDFEYTITEGIIKDLLINNDRFLERVEPFHETPKEWEVSFRDLALNELGLCDNYFE